MAHHHLHPMVFHRSDHVIGILKRDAQGLLDQDVFAMGSRHEYMRFMQVRGRRNINSINRCSLAKTFNVLIRLRLKISCECCQGATSPICGCCDLDMGVFDKGW
jgi:hypothetical protein